MIIAISCSRRSRQGNVNFAILSFSHRQPLLNTFAIVCELSPFGQEVSVCVVSSFSLCYSLQLEFRFLVCVSAASVVYSSLWTNWPNPGAHYVYVMLHITYTSPAAVVAFGAGGDGSGASAAAAAAAPDDDV